MGAAAIAVINMKERHIVDAFRQAGATSTESARIPEDLNVPTHGIPWRDLVRQAILREADGGRFYLDVPSWEANRRSRLRRLAILTVLVIAFGLWIATTRR